MQTVISDNTGKKSYFISWRTVLEKENKIASFTFLQCGNMEETVQQSWVYDRKETTLAINEYPLEEGVWWIIEDEFDFCEGYDFWFHTA